MSLDDFFDRFDRLNKRHLVDLDAGFVTTERLSVIVIGNEFKPYVEKYYPQHTVLDAGDEIMVFNDER